MAFFYFLSSYFLSYSSSLISALVFVDAGMPLITTFTVGNKNKSLVGYALNVCAKQNNWKRIWTILHPTALEQQLDIRRFFSFFKIWKTGKVHCGILNKFYSFSHQIILSSYSVPVREVFILSIKWHYRGTTTTNFVFLIEWVYWFDRKLETTLQ